MQICVLLDFIGNETGFREREREIVVRRQWKKEFSFMRCCCCLCAARIISRGVDAAAARHPSTIRHHYHPPLHEKSTFSFPSLLPSVHPRFLSLLRVVSLLLLLSRGRIVNIRKKVDRTTALVSSSFHRWDKIRGPLCGGPLLRRNVSLWRENSFTPTRW